MMITLSSKGQLVLPSPLRCQDRLHAGECFEVERLDSGKYLLTRQSPPPNEGLVDLLLSCPEKDWFEPIPSESTSTL